MFKVQITYPESFTEKAIETDTAINMNTPAVNENDNMLYGTMKLYVDRGNKTKESLDIIESITKEYSTEKVTKLFDSIEDPETLNDIFSYIYNRISSQYESEVYMAINVIKSAIASTIDVTTIDTDKEATEDEPTTEVEEEKIEEVAEAKEDKKKK